MLFVEEISAAAPPDPSIDENPTAAQANAQQSY
jgi:hypothetical protein